MGVAANHWNCNISHPARQGYRKDRLHERGCRVAERHDPGTIAIECRACRHAYGPKPKTGYKVFAGERHYDCPLTPREHVPPISGSRTGHREGCPTKPNHTGKAGFGCGGCRVLYRGEDDSKLPVGKSWDSPHWDCKLPPNDHTPIPGIGYGHREGCNLAEGHNGANFDSCRKCHQIVYRNGVLKREFSMTRSEYEERLLEQRGVCAICGQPDKRELAVDHDHATGKVRGLLCHHCNLMLGHAKDQPDLLRSALSYLARHGSR